MGEAVVDTARTDNHTVVVRVQAGVRFLVRNPSDFVYRQLAITGLADLFGCPGPAGGSPPGIRPGRAGTTGTA